ncbi:MAG: DNA mismatch repair endonuclease MutL [Tissierellia bacterium]|nr:DNA mismatch repair endonuclease MutL [Tissierellia bacterium]
MNRIKVLDELTIQKIAAGEIIERPSSIVKELVENSLDAKSSNITIEIRNGGKSYIRVTDDGEGIAREDLSIAFKRHSTSKLSSADDLYQIMSFGFRGEALASISTISKVEVLTKTDENPIGTHAFLEEGNILKLESVGCPKGTTMIVTHMFYNVPVRENFLKSDMIEANNVSDIVYKLALGNPGVSFKYIKDNKVLFKTSRNNDLISNIYALLGKDFNDNLIKVNYESSNLKVHGYISNNKFYRSNKTHQYLYVNNRYIKNYNISSLIENQYKSIIPINKFPVFILFIDMDPKLIDVNIHPTKEEIKFMNQQKINEELGYIIDKTINESLSIPKTKFKQRKEKPINELPLLYDENFLTKKSHLETYDNYDNIENKDTIAEDRSYHIKEDVEDLLVDEPDKNNYELINILGKGQIIGTLFFTYILVEDLQSSKLFVVDQHAAHERVMYEKFKEEYKEENISIQHLLKPEIIELSNAETQLVVKNIDLFKKLGFMVEEFGTNSVIIRGVPILFGKPQVKNLFLELVDTIESNIESSYEVKLDKIIKISCTRAIKSGDKMNNIEIESLFKQLCNTKNPYTCPHGRPTIIEISKTDIDKEFKRIT